MFEQLLGLSIVRRQLERSLDFHPREIRLLLLEVDLCQHRSNHRGIPRFQRSLQFLHRIIHLALAAVNFREPAVRRGAARIGGKNSSKFLLRGIGVSYRKFLPAAPDVSHGDVARRSGSSPSRGGAGRVKIRAKSPYAEPRPDAAPPGPHLTLAVPTD